MHTSLSKKLLAGLLSLVMVLSLVAPSMGTQAASKYTLTNKTSVKADVTYKYQLKGVSKNQYVKVTRNVSGETVKYNKKAVSKTTKINGTGKTLNLYVTYGEKAENYTGKFTVKVYSKKTNKVAKTLVEKVTVKVPEKEAVTSVSINNTTPKVGDTINAVTTPENATNVASINWYVNDKVVEGATETSFTVPATCVPGDKIKAVVADAEGNTFESEVATVAENAEADLAITAEQTGASVITVKANQAVATTDAVVVKRGTSTVDSTFVTDAAGTTVTITTGTKLADAEYTITVTPKDTTKKAATATLTAKVATLEKIDFVGENLVMKNSNYTACAVKIFGYNTFGEKVALSTLQPYTTKGTASYSAADNEISLTLADGTQLFTMGETITVTAVYQDGTNVKQVSKALTVSSMASVAEMTFGELDTTSTALKGKQVNLTAMRSNSYFKTVIAKDQYGETLTAKELNDILYNSVSNAAGTLFVTPSQAAGSYVYVDTFDTDSKGNVIEKFKLGDLAMPGTQTITYTAIGGFTTTDSITVVDDPYIADLTVNVPELYGGKEVEITVSGKDQDGNNVDMYDFVGTKNGGSGAITKVGGAGVTYVFDDYNSTTKGNSTISIPSGLTLKVTKNTATKTVKFLLKPDANTTAQHVNRILVVQSAKPTVSNVTCTVQTNPYPYGISSKLASTGDNTVLLKSGKTVDLSKQVLVLDQYGASFGYVYSKAGTANKLLKSISGTKIVSTQNAAINEDFVVEVFGPESTTTPLTNWVVGAQGKYTVNLWYDEDGTGTDKKYKLVDTKTFTVNVANTTYSDYTASLKSNDGLLYAGTATSQIDSETIVVKAKDSAKQEVKLDAGTDYTVSFEDIPKGTNGSDIFSETVEGTVQNDPTNGTSYSATAGEFKGEMTANVYVGTQIVASVKVPYSNAPQVTKKYACNGGTYDLARGIELESSLAGSYYYDNRPGKNALYFDVDGNGSTMTTPGAGIATDADAVADYAITAVDQYGLSNFTAKLGSSCNLNTQTDDVVGDYGTVTLSGTKTETFELTNANASYVAYVARVDLGAVSFSGTGNVNARLDGVKVYDQHGKQFAASDITATLDGSNGAGVDEATTKGTGSDAVKATGSSWAYASNAITWTNAYATNGNNTADNKNIQKVKLTVTGASSSADEAHITITYSNMTAATPAASAAVTAIN